MTTPVAERSAERLLLDALVAHQKLAGELSHALPHLRYALRRAEDRQLVTRLETALARSQSTLGAITRRSVREVAA